MTAQFAVFGTPIAHSLSPTIHTLFANQCGIELDYNKHQVELKQFSDSASEFFTQGGIGLNITSPLKEAAFEYADLLSDRALNAGAVNTLHYLDDDMVYGDNTDGAGLIRDLTTNLNVPLKNSNILILGAGGAVQGCLSALLKQNPQSVCISNRTPSKAQKLVEQYDLSKDSLEQSNLIPNDAQPNASSNRTLSVLGKEYDETLSFDLIINATSASAHGAQPAIDHRYLSNAICYDMMYGDNAAAFIKWSLAQGSNAAYDGLGMLVEQAAESFYLWHEVRPETAPVLQQLRQTAPMRR